jgi:hypothetical protein
MGAAVELHSSVLRNKKWHLQDGVLYSPRRVSDSILAVWILVVFLVSGWFPYQGDFVFYFFSRSMMVVVLCFSGWRSYKAIKIWGGMGEPVVRFSGGELYIGSMVAAAGRGIAIKVYKDDVVTLNGVDGMRFIRLQDGVHEDRVIRLLSKHSGKIIRFLLRRLRQGHTIIDNPPPTFMEQVRGDY